MTHKERLAQLYDQIHDLHMKNHAMPDLLCQEFIEVAAEMLRAEGTHIRKRTFKKFDRW